MKIFVETDRFLLREIVESDLQGFFELDTDPEVHRYLGNQPLTTLEECAGVIEYVRKQYEADGMGRWAVIDKATNDFVGWSGLKHEKKVRDYPYYDLGYRLKRNYWGKGIATETAIASVDYGFRVMNLPKICAAAHVDNIGSNRVLQKAGLTFVETFVVFEGLHNWYELEQSDWKENQDDS